MAYKKYGKRRFYKRRRSRTVPWYRKKYSAAQLAVKAVRGVNYLRGLVNAELHKHDFGNITTVNWSGTVIPLFGIPIGDLDSERTGNSIFVRYINTTGSIVKNASADFTTVTIKMFIDKQQIGDTQPSSSDILETTGNAYSPFAKLNTETVGRFSIIHSRTYNLNSDRPSCLFSIRKTLRHHVRYNGATGGDIQKGGIYLMIITDQQSTLPTITHDTRVSYYDN